MIRYGRRDKALAVSLSVLAGFVDALGFIELGGYFVSFMSGNSTRLGVALYEARGHVPLAAALIGSFVVGVMGGTLVGHARRDQRRATVLLSVTLLLGSAAALSALGYPRAALLVVAAAMGAENAVFEREGEVAVGLTYMTGTLVKFGQRLVGAFLGGSRTAWMGYLALWAGLVVGVLAGTATHASLGLGGLWVATLWAAVLTLLSLRTTAVSPQT